MREFGIGQSVPRFEDVRLLRGRGRYTDDIRLPGQAYLFVLRSPHAFARIRNIDPKAALEVPGVLAVLTGEDALADGLGTFSSRVTRHRPDGSPNFVPPYRVLASGCARHIGDPVAAVVAHSPHAAKDAAELVEVDYEPLPSVTDTAAAVAEGAPAVWDEVPDNVCFLYELGDAAGVEDAFARAAHVARVDFTVSRDLPRIVGPRRMLVDHGRRPKV